MAEIRSLSGLSSQILLNQFQLHVLDARELKLVNYRSNGRSRHLIPNLTEIRSVIADKQDLSTDHSFQGHVDQLQNCILERTADFCALHFISEPRVDRPALTGRTTGVRSPPGRMSLRLSCV